jgi:hypothetical protein
MVRLHPVIDFDPPQDLRREIRDVGDADRLAFRQRAPILRLPWSGMAMMWPGILGEVALAREEEDWTLH